MSAPIFISYSSMDRETAETLCRALEARGHKCWIACRDVRPGENFQESIVRALREARVMLLVFSGNANNSDEIKKELVLAGRHHVTVVQARIEDVVPSDAFTYELATRQWIDLFRDWEREIEQLAAQLDHILQTEKSGPTVLPSPRPAVQHRASNTPLIMGLALAILLLLIGGTVFYLRPWQKPASVAAPPPAPSVAMQAPAPSPPVQARAPEAVPAPSAEPPVRHSAPPVSAPKQTAIAAPPPAPVPPPPAAAPVAPPAPAPAAADPDEAAWQSAVVGNSQAGFADYIRNFSAGSHVQDAELRIANLILNAPATGSDFDGNWQTSWTCPNRGQYPGYSYQFVGQVKDGVFHGVKGVKGQPSSLVIDGKIEADGAAAFSGEIIVGSSLAGLGAARGSASDYYAQAQFQHSSGTGKRIEGRPCNLTFERQ